MMTRSAPALLAALEARRILEVDVGLANDHPFLLMASVGFDADVVHDLAARRGNSISHLSYLPPIIEILPSLADHDDQEEPKRHAGRNHEDRRLLNIHAPRRDRPKQ